MTFLRTHLRTILGALAGALAGAAYAYFIGCRTGTCPLTGDARVAAVFFGITGALVAAPGPKPKPRAPAADRRP